MPAHRKPTEILRLNGSFAHDPKRERPIGPKSQKELGNCPRYFSDAEKAVWKEIVGNCAANVLTSSDRIIVELVARLLAKFRADWLTGSEMGQLTSSLARLGWSPADRSRVAAIEAEPIDEYAEFRN